QDVVRAMTEAGASAYCVKGAPLWELERAIVGASPPLFRLAHAVTRSLSPNGISQLVTRELAELTGAVLVAGYLGATEASLTLAGAAGDGAQLDVSQLSITAPEIARRAFDAVEPVSGDPGDGAELLALFGVPYGETLAVPFVADGERLGALLIAMPAN